MITIDQFRTDFPEFGSTSDYPNAQVQFWLTMAGQLLRPDAWQDSLDLGTELYIAHHIAISAKNRAVASVGGVPGTVNGPQSSKAVDKVSASYDTGAVALADGGFWNATMYGIQFLQLARMAGTGGRQL